MFILFLKTFKEFLKCIFNRFNVCGIHHTSSHMVQSMLYVAFYFLKNILCKRIFLKIKMLYNASMILYALTNRFLLYNATLYTKYLFVQISLFVVGGGGDLTKARPLFPLSLCDSLTLSRWWWWGRVRVHKNANAQTLI